MTAILPAGDPYRPPSLRSDASADLWAEIEREAARCSAAVAAALGADWISLFGCGFHGRHAAASLDDEGRRPAAFFDNDPRKVGTRQAGLPVLPLDDYRPAQHGFVLITARHVVPVLSRQLAGRGIPHLSYDAFFVARHLGRFQAVRERFFDEPQSRTVFDRLLLAMLTGDAAPLAVIVAPDQYFHFPAEARLPREIFVDAGAHDGDTIAAFLEAHQGRFETIFAFEPTPATFAALAGNVELLAERWGFATRDVALFNAGVGAASGTLGIAADPAMPTSNALVAHGGEDSEGVPVVPLDEALGGAKVTFLKADVEGMELAMLRGAARTITTHRPKLAISLYHRMEDFLDIPAAIAELSGDYRFGLRHHTASLLETVLYASCVDQPSDRTP